MLQALQARRAFHASQAALNRRFADENTARGMDVFAAQHLALADREQRKANALSVTLREMAS
jgi:hypothetical protein